MKTEIIAKLKEASEQIDEQIRSASAGMRTGDKDRFQFARMKIQEAITKLLEVT